MKTTPFGLIALLSKTRIHLPLIHIETRFRITGEVLAVEMEQVFEQTSRKPLDVTYTFPLPGAAAVYRCEMIVNDRLIRAVVMPRSEAIELVAEKKAAGHRTALVEMDRDNLFTLQLGNVTPGDRIVIRFAYIESLERQGTQLSLRIPFSHGVRYIPGKPLLRANRGLGSSDDTDEVPDASRLSPPRISRDHPDAATMYLHGVFDDAEVALSTLHSPTHAAILRSLAGRIECELAGEEQVPDRDFVLRWEEITAAEPIARAWATSDASHLYALLQVRAPLASAVKTSDDFAQDIYFLLDRSGSMSGMKWVKSAEALHAFVRTLGKQDRVWISCFESRFQDFSDVPMLRDEMLADDGFLGLAELDVLGGTELLPALEHVLTLRQRHSKDRPARLILITDGQVGNDDVILYRMTKPDAARLPVHCFGIDDAVNDAFLGKLARETGGRCALLTPSDDIPAAVQRLAETLRRPVLTDLLLQGDVLAAKDAARLPDLHAGEVTLIAVRAAANTSEIVLQARLPDGGGWAQRFALQPDAEDAAPRLQWARQHCSQLIAKGQSAEAIALAIEHNLVCEGTSFVAWDEAEKVTVAKLKVYQPALVVEEDTACYGAPMRNVRRSFSMSPPSSKPLSKSCSMGPPLSRAGKGQKAGKTAPKSELQIHRQLTTDVNPKAIPLFDLLITAGVPPQAASALALQLWDWAGAVISQSRRKLLEGLTASVVSSIEPLEDLRRFIKSNVVGDEGESLLALLEGLPTLD